ncbi:hypothetical protein EXIGLDRAFT_381618 [Exidia glandulosa HHB12029]|uniref:Uncharacterized protein n=1 Tax=Exidia glandulosa HHB12029 TaxID=1314781 RepID=A0A165BZI5_EXIGL|nr:hypothetical protein EXIGLDRAFT_381618 [Exidia glandulosa HHB12029]
MVDKDAFVRFTRCLAVKLVLSEGARAPGPAWGFSVPARTTTILLTRERARRSSPPYTTRARERKTVGALDRQTSRGPSSEMKTRGCSGRTRLCFEMEKHFSTTACRAGGTRTRPGMHDVWLREVLPRARRRHCTRPRGPTRSRGVLLRQDSVWSSE